jgi:hypothetical protein
MENIQIKGIERLDEAEKSEVSRILESSYEKIKYKTKTDFILKISIKIYSKDKENLVKRKKYSIQAGIFGATRDFEASAFDWDLNKAIHKVLNKLENEIEHKFHSSEQYKK